MELLKKIFGLLKQTFKEYQEDNISRLAAALAYYTIFSLAPLLIIAISVAGFIWSQRAAESQVLAQMESLLGPQGTNFIQSLLDNASSHLQDGGGVFTTVIGVGVLIFGSVKAFRELREALNTIWDVETPKQKGLWNSMKAVIKTDVLSFAMVMGVGFLLIVSLIFSTLLSTLGEILKSSLPLPNVWMAILNNLVTLFIFTIVFSILFKYLPQTRIAWGDVTLGGFVTALLFLAGKALIGLYLGNSSIGASFGAAGSLALLLVWIYYSAQILFLGAEFTQVYANQYGSNIPKYVNKMPESKSRLEAENV
ncbi:MAG: ribonuclease BN [Anaerolineaceae bacterium]|nr:ribonuclease BN [Anaerolineaceae bacterium]